MTRAWWSGLLLVVAACSAFPIGSRDVPGTYVMNRGRAADSLIVLRQGRYRHVYRMPGQPAAIDSGTWFADQSTRRMVVRFSALWPRWRAETETSSLRRSPVAPLIWSVEPIRTLSGRMKFWVDEDLDWAYVRRR